MPRSTMAALIARARKLLNGDTVFSEDDLQALLDQHAVPFRALLTPDKPGYTTHRTLYGDIEDGVVLALADGTVLSSPADYTIDLARGIVTTPTAELRALWLQGTSYDVYAAAADSWEQIAARDVRGFDFGADGATFKRSQIYEYALRQAERMRARANPVIA